jgi:hypothetical protein
MVKVAMVGCCGESVPGTGECRRPRTAAGGGLEFVEKLLPTNLTSTDTTERNLGMRLRVPAVASLVDLLLALAPRRAGLVAVAHHNAMPRT